MCTRSPGRWARVSLCALLVLSGAGAWDPDQLEVFDVVEEVNQNFYQLMNISQGANSSVIKKAFRALSLVLHPDKNAAEDADVQFRNLVAVYDVLKDPNKRKHYDEVLVNGLPNWKSAMYYYRHYRKMGLTEMIIILSVLITVGQYLISWASYFEQKYTHEQVHQAKLEKKKKKLSKKGQTVEDIIEKFEINKPSFLNTLPFQLPRLIWHSIWGIPAAIRTIRELMQENELKRKREEEERLVQQQLEADVEFKRQRDKEARRRKAAQGYKLQERQDSDLPPKIERTEAPEGEGKPQKPVTGGLWTDDDLAELVQLVKKFPGGTTDRWEKIAETMNRSVPEVTYMAAKLKENCYRVPGRTEEETQPELEPAEPKKQKTRGGKVGELAENVEWSQTQQRALEAALAKYPKGPADRWDKIARCVPDKTKEECMVRYKHLAEMVRKKKSNENED